MICGVAFANKLKWGEVSQALKWTNGFFKDLCFLVPYYGYCEIPMVMVGRYIAGLHPSCYS